jgi:hypothetical protein
MWEVDFIPALDSQVPSSESKEDGSLIHYRITECSLVSGL